jgi:hypothetical protein
MHQLQSDELNNNSISKPNATIKAANNGNNQIEWASAESNDLGKTSMEQQEANLPRPAARQRKQSLYAQENESKLANVQQEASDKAVEQPQSINNGNSVVSSSSSSISSSRVGSASSASIGSNNGSVAGTQRPQQLPLNSSQSKLMNTLVNSPINTFKGSQIAEAVTSAANATTEALANLILPSSTADAATAAVSKNQLSNNNAHQGSDELQKKLINKQLHSHHGSISSTTAPAIKKPKHKKPWYSVS